MIDIKLIRQTPEVLDNSLESRGAYPISHRIIDLDSQYRECLTKQQEFQSRRNAVAKQFGEAKKNGQNTTELSKEAESIKSMLYDLERQVSTLQAALHDEMSVLPNILLPEVPHGKDESSNQELRRIGEVPTFSFAPKSHDELGADLGMMDFEHAAAMSGSRFVVLSGPLARLERALASFMLDVHTQEHGYTEVNPPLLVHSAAVYGTGQLPNLKEDMFKTNSDHWLIPTSEVALTNLVSGDILPADALPKRFTAYTPCFRAEAGAAGRDTRGMIRQHQFGKVELVSIVMPEDVEEEHQRMTRAAETILEKLGLSYVVKILCTGDTGFSSQKTYDIEVWLPSQQTYREISSCSQCGDFQARRMNARYRTADGKPDFVHTLNGSGVAVGRALVAVMENYQQEDGSIVIPPVLRPYMMGLERIEKK